MKKFSISKLLALLCAVAFASRFTSSAPVRSVLVFRHCVRSTKNTTYYENTTRPLNDFSAQPEHAFPKWPVPEYECMPQGLDHIQSAGEQLFPSLPQPLLAENILVDAGASRDNDTAKALLRGFGYPEDFLTPDACLFDPVSCRYCPSYPSDTMAAAVQARFESFPPPHDLEALLTSLQTRVLLPGIAPALPDIPNVVSDDGWLVGGVTAGADIAETFLMQLGSGYGVSPNSSSSEEVVGWGEITPEEVRTFLQLQVYKRGVQDRTLVLDAYSHSNMANTIMDFLDGSGNGTLILVGHDTELDALATLFGISWNTDPFPMNATTPGSALRFDVVDDSSAVAVSMHYQTLEPGTSDVLTVPAQYTWWTSTILPSLVDIRDWLSPRLDDSCSPSKTNL